MKQILILISFLLFGGSNIVNAQLTGAWKNTSGAATTVVLFQNGYFTATTFSGSSFTATRGGPFEIVGNKVTVRQEFNSAEKELVVESIPFRTSNNILTLGKQKFEKTDNGTAPLAGVWKITGRMEDGKINQIHQSGTRKTLKMLTGKRFQWFAIDPDGNKFSGTGGGTYSFENGKYIENIEFFSRDSTRVGAALSFDDHLDEGKWHHTGLSSRGDKIYEIWEHVNSGNN